MARRDQVQRPSEYTLFEVVYEDNGRSSNRKESSSQLDGRKRRRP